MSRRFAASCSRRWVCGHSSSARGCTSTTASSRGRECSTGSTNTTYLVRIDEHDPSATIDLQPEGVVDLRWWTLDELLGSSERFAPLDLPERVRTLLA